jgi:hypothetical protein
MKLDTMVANLVVLPMSQLRSLAKTILWVVEVRRDSTCARQIRSSVSSQAAEAGPGSLGKYVVTHSILLAEM